MGFVRSNIIDMIKIKFGTKKDEIPSENIAIISEGVL